MKRHVSACGPRTLSSGFSHESDYMTSTTLEKPVLRFAVRIAIWIVFAMIAKRFGLEICAMAFAAAAGASMARYVDD